jgi:hypothetical protein
VLINTGRRQHGTEKVGDRRSGRPQPEEGAEEEQEQQQQQGQEQEEQEQENAPAQ